MTRAFVLALCSVPWMPVLASNATVWFDATTTNFGGGEGSCGGCSLAMFGNTPGWATVAVAESMQIPYGCKPCPDCHCATGDAQRTVGGPPGGCGQCYEVQTTGTNPYGAQLPIVSFNAMVADSCPYAANQEWCPGNVGDVNRHGYQFHIDVFSSDHSKLNIGDNPIVKFRPIDCPNEIIQVAQQQCCDVWYQGQGCPNICPQDTCPPNEGPWPSPVPMPAPVPPSPVPLPVPPPSPSGCPGGSLSACIDLCPADTFAACVESCKTQCPSMSMV